MNGGMLTRWSLGVLLLILVLVPRPLMAQVTTADVVGTVSDSTGALLPGVTVTARNEATGNVETALTDAGGNFQILRLPPGRYRLTTELQGFKTVDSDVTLAIGDRYRLGLKLEVGTVEEHLTVVAQTPLLQTETASVAVLVDERAMQDLPLNGRNFVRLAQIAPGAHEGPPNSLSSGNRPDDRRQSSSISINGQDTSLNNFLIDGLDNNERFIGTVIVRPSVDAIQEMRVETNSFSAELGRAAGGVINVVTKSGTNQLHGSAFEFYRNEAFDARNFFATSGPKPEFKLHQFGGSLGGRIIADKSFFFVDYAGLRLRQGNTYTSTVPTLGMRRGDFSGLAPIFDPLTGAPFPNNQIPASRMDRAAVALTNLFPVPANNALANNFTYSPTKTQDDDSFDIRIDHRIDNNNVLFGRYSYNNTTTVLPDSLPPVDGVTPGGLGNTIFPGTSSQKPQAAQVNYDHVFSPSLVLEAKGGFSRYDAGTLTSNYGLNVSQQMGIPGINVEGDLDSSGLSRITIAGFTELGDAGFIPLIIANDLWQGLSTLTYIAGAHTLKFGVDLKHRAVVAQQSTSARGLFAFNANFTSNGGAAGTGHPFASFLLGYPSSSSRNKYLVKPTYLSLEASSFVQYDWRVRRWMTLNLGVRYDYFSELSEADNQISNVDLASGKIIVAGKDTSSTAGLVGDLNNFAPRIGFAATVVPGTVVRGGYGISYTPPVQGTGGALRNPPFVSLFDITPSAFVPVNRLAEGLPLPVPASTTAPTGALAPIDFNIAMPWVHQFNVAVQRELPGQMAATAAYVGVLGRDLVVSVPVNTPPPGPGAVQGRRPLVNVFPSVAGIGYRTNAQTANYRALQLILDKRFSAGWGGRVGYTWSHHRITAPDSQYPFTSIPAGLNPFPAMLDNIKYETADAGQDIRHRLTVGVNYELGLAREATGVAGFLAKGWQINAIAVMQSGTPFNITNGTARSNTGSGDRPNQIKESNLPSDDRTLTRWFDTSAFDAQPNFTLGNTPLNSMHGPGFASLDLSFFKDFVPRSGTRIQFRIETFNVTNRTNFGNPGGALGTASFGVISSAGQARNVQLALKYIF
jgi:Carboxypeptidase regulatory-like domain